MNIREQALQLLGNGNDETTTANCLGVTVGAISQLCTNEDFAKELAALRFMNLRAATNRDGKYDALEDTMLEKLEENAQFMHKPREILQALAILNNAKRRGAKLETRPQDSPIREAVAINLPRAVVNHFRIDVRQTVVAIGNQDLTTMTAKGLTALQEKLAKPKAEPEAINGDFENEESNRIRALVATG